MTQLNFRKSIAALAEEYEIKRSIWDGNIREITVHFPPGCNALVEVKVFHGSTQILPEKGGLALDDATPTFIVEREVRAGDSIRVDWINHDDSYAHTVSVIVGIIRKPLEAPILPI